MLRARRVVFLSFGAVITIAACGGAVAPMEAPKGSSGGAAYPAGPEPEPQTIEEATAQLERARAAVEHPAPPPPANTGVQATAPTPGHVEPMGAGEDVCGNLCRAFSSMQRAQAAICRMAGESDPRCVEAKRVVEDNAKRVAQCSCR